jgi:hypothetical protein
VDNEVESRGKRTVLTAGKAEIWFRCKIPQSSSEILRYSLES